MGRRKLDAAVAAVTVTSRIPGAVVTRLDAEARRRNMTRSSLVAAFVARGLDAEKGLEGKATRCA